MRCVTAGPKGGSPAVCVDRFECCELAKTMCPFGPFPFSSGADVERPAPLRCTSGNDVPFRPVSVFLRCGCRKTRPVEMPSARMSNDPPRKMPPTRMSKDTRRRDGRLAMNLTSVAITGFTSGSTAHLGGGAWRAHTTILLAPPDVVPGFNLCLNPFRNRAQPLF